MGSGSHRSVWRASSPTEARTARCRASSRWSRLDGTSEPVKPFLPVLPALRHPVPAIMALRSVRPVDPPVIRRSAPATACLAF